MSRSIKISLFIIGQVLLLMFVWGPLFFMGIALATCGGDETMFKVVGVSFSLYIFASFFLFFRRIVKKSASEIMGSELKQVIRYIETARAEGFSDDQIRLNLYNVGWAQQDVLAAFTAVGSQDRSLSAKHHHVNE